MKFADQKIICLLLSPLQNLQAIKLRFENIICKGLPGENDQKKNQISSEMHPLLQTLQVNIIYPKRQCPNKKNM